VGLVASVGAAMTAGPDAIISAGAVITVLTQTGTNEHFHLIYPHLSMVGDHIRGIGAICTPLPLRIAHGARELKIELA